MDSGNSGSMQSSSTGGGGGGDEEYDSRVESSFSAFLNNATTPPSQPRHVIIPFTSNLTNNVSNPQLDPFSNYLDPIQRISHQNSSIVNLDNMVWSRPSRSELPNHNSHLGNLIPCNSISSSSSSQNQLQQQQQQQGVIGLGAFSTTHHSSMPPPENANKNNMVRNPKKRSRASRRAPTTVLTTDTTNFRAMVQEFTGIPAPPFTSSPFQRTRLDLFGSASNIPSSQPPYLLRPFAQKLHPFPPSSTSSIPSMVENTLTSNQLGHNMMNNMHNNQILSFQSMIPQNTKYPLGNNSNVLVTSKSIQPSLEIPNSVDSHRVLAELGLSHAHVNSTTAHVSGFHHNMVSSSSTSGAALSRVINNNNNMRDLSSEDWVERINNNNDGDDHGNYNNNIHGEKGPECGGVAARGEGMVESWINCSSD